MSRRLVPAKLEERSRKLAELSGKLEERSRKFVERKRKLSIQPERGVVFSGVGGRFVDRELVTSCARGIVPRPSERSACPPRYMAGADVHRPSENSSGRLMTA